MDDTKVLGLIAPHLEALEDRDVVRGAVVSTVALSDSTVITTVTSFGDSTVADTSESKGTSVNLDAAFDALIKVHV